MYGRAPPQYISTRNGRIQNGWTRPVFRHYRGQAVWIQSGNKLKKGTVVALANKPHHAQLGRLQTNQLASPLKWSHIPIKPEETESEISDPMMVHNQTVTRSQTGTLVRPLDRFSPRREM